MSEKIRRLLLIDDAEVEHLWLERLVRQIEGADYRLDWAADYPAGMAALDADRHDLYFVDFRLGHQSGLDLIRRARTQGVIKPIIMLTSHGSPAVDVAALEAGANDYLVKGEFDLVLLDRVMRYATRHARTLAEQRTMMAHFVQLVEQAPSAMLMSNEAGLIELVNAQAERLFGYPRAELIGTPMNLLVPDRLPAAPHGLRRNGSEIEIEIRLSPISTAEGMKTLAAIVDVSERVRLEAAARQAEKLHAIGRVTAGVAHDLNNLLTILSGSLELLLDTVPDRPEAVEWGQGALRAIARGRELTDRLLSFARQQVLTPRPILITTLFSELQALIGHLFAVDGVPGINLVITPGPLGLAVLADHAQLEAALINLAVNARDAMQTNGYLRISASPADADPAVVPAGKYTVISLTDTGHGMDAATLAQACEPFFTTKGAAGTGLGLSMVQGFARQSGGEAHITSIVGQGTTIALWLPAPRPPSSGRILLVDDNIDALLILATFLRAAGHEVISHESAESALADLAGGQRFAAVVTDFAMPGMNGQELLRRARLIDPALPGLVITGFTDPAILADLQDFIVLRKPFSRIDLTKSVRQIIEAARAAALS